MKKEKKTFELHKRFGAKDNEPPQIIEYYEEVSPSNRTSYYFLKVGHRQFIDLLGCFEWKYPCSIRVSTTHGHYHSLHFEQRSDMRSFSDGYFFLRSDMQVVDESQVPYAWLTERIPNMLDDCLKEEMGSLSDELRIKNSLNKMIKTSRFVDMQPGDEIWKFDNQAWGAMAGRKGYALVRNNEIIDHITTTLS